MKRQYILCAFAAALLIPAAGNAQNLQIGDKEGMETYILPSRDTVTVAFDNDMTTIPVMSNCKYTATTDAPWISLKQTANGSVAILGQYYFDAVNERQGIVKLTSEDGTFTQNIVVKQTPNNSASTLQGDHKITVTGGSASQAQTGEGIDKSYDGNTSTMYHSPYNGTRFPVTLTYNLKDAPHVDYMTYTPRQDGNINGNFGKVKIEYALASEPSKWIELTETDLGQSDATTRFEFGENGIDGVGKVKVTVNSGGGNFAACAEMQFFTINSELSNLTSTYFEDALCTKVKSGVTKEDAMRISNPYFRQLVYNMLDTDYSTKYRVGEFEAYRPLGDLQSELRTSSRYCRYENPTGIYFEKGETLAIFVEGITDSGISLIIKSFGKNRSGENHPESSYPLSNGMNVIKTQNRGNGYISYYSDDYQTAPKVKIHFAMATENGYFDLQRGDTNEDWTNLLANAKSDIIDVRSERMQVAVPLEDLLRYTPKKGVELATIYDNVIYRQHEIMGLDKYGRKPKNRQFARPVDSGMFADGTGAAAAFGSFHEWSNADNFGFWGFGHELGHNNQIAPGGKWSGCGETTNNIYASWVEHKLGNGYHRLEDENSGIDEYNGWRGGRFQIYLEEGVRKGISWQLQDGADYHGATPNNVTVAEEDYDGNRTGKQVTTTSRNYDHFVKVVPLYQLALFTQDAGKAKDAYGDVYESIRTEYHTDMNLSNGKLQVKFMKRFCDATKMDLLPFFEKAGMLKPINAYIEDYSPGWIKINEEMINELKEYVKGKGYAVVPEALNYINAYNLDVFRNEAKLVGNTINAGCKANASKGYVTVEHSEWQNVVGFETYDANNKLIRISMYGLGAAQKSSNQTKVLWPSDAAYIMAVGFDGTRIKCYEP